MPALGLDFERSLNAQPSEARRAIGEALREAGFQVTAEQLTRIEAKRGSRLLGGSLMPTRMLPIIASFDIAPDGPACIVSAHLVDHHINLGGKAWGWNQTYRRLFGEVQEVVDHRLARLDPAAGAAFVPARFWSAGGEVAALEQAQTLGARAGETVVDKASSVLEGGPKDRAPAAWKGVDSVTFTSAQGCAVLSLAEAQAHLGVAVMIASHPGSMPPNLARDVELFAARVEQALTSAAGSAAEVQVSEAERPVLEFLNRQVRIREGLPVRTLHTCRACHHQNVTNEDLARLQARNRHLRDIVGGVGATISSGGVKPFLLLGQVFKLKKLDPDYVCPQCQGLDADEQIVTFCPQCGAMRPEAALRECPKCHLDFGRRLTPETFWLTREAAAAILAPPVSDPAADAEAGSPAIVPTSVEPEPSAEVGQWLFCPACGAQLTGDYQFCPGCGGPVRT
jgi:hypothetical protein